MVCILYIPCSDTPGVLSSHKVGFEGWGPWFSVVPFRHPGIRASLGLSKCVRLHGPPERLVVFQILCETFYVIIIISDDDDDDDDDDASHQ